MKPWIELAVRLYPTPWRARYGTEFRALLDEVNPGWRELFDVIKGALKMRLTNGATYIKSAVAFGLIAAIATSFFVPKYYVSTAVLRVAPTQAADVFDPVAISQTESEVLSRTSLSMLIQRGDLYTRDRKNIPLEQVIDQMRRDIRIEVIRKSNASEAFSITFQYDDRTKSEAVVSALTTQFATVFNRQRDINEHLPGATAFHQNLEVLEPPHVLKTPIGSNWLLTASIGLGVGLPLGLLVAVFVKHTRPALASTCMGLCGCLLGFAISFYIPHRYVSQAEIRIVPFDRLAGTSEGQVWLVQNAEKVSRETGLYPNDLSFHIVTNTTAPGAPSTTLQIHYADRDPKQAQLKLLALINHLRDETAEGMDRPAWRLRQGFLEYLDAASIPMRDVSEVRTKATLLGLALGLVFSGLILNARRASVRFASEPHE